MNILRVRAALAAALCVVLAVPATHAAEAPKRKPAPILQATRVYAETHPLAMTPDDLFAKCAELNDMSQGEFSAFLDRTPFDKNTLEGFARLKSASDAIAIAHTNINPPVETFYYMCSMNILLIHIRLL